MILLALLLAIAPRVERVEVDLGGVRHTKTSAVRRLMTTRDGSALDEETLRRDVARLRATGILYDVEERTVAGPLGTRVELSLKDRWTLLPLFGLRRGGGRTAARVGLSDHNAFGHLFSLYGEVTSNADVPFFGHGPDDRLGSYVYVRVPRVFGSRFTPGVYWTREFLDYARFAPGARPTYLYDRQRHELRFETRYELTDFVSASAGVTFSRDRFSQSSLSPSAGQLPDAGQGTWLVLGAQAGMVEELLSMLRGTQIEVSAAHAVRGLLGSDLSATSFSATVRSFWVPAPGRNLCAQIVARTTTGRSDALLFRAGGLREIRGFPDAFFQAQQLVHGNLELRADVLRTDVLVPAIGQIAGFTDFGWVGSRAAGVAGLPYTGPVASAGVGLRWIPIPFARAVGRLDVAVGMVPERRVDISLGGQHFF
jgi:outer membrane protein assembly factor BamA